MPDKIVKNLDKNIMVEGKSLDSYVNGDTFNLLITSQTSSSDSLPAINLARAPPGVRG